MNKTLLGAVLALFLWALPAMAAPSGTKPQNDVPTKITANKMVYEAEKRQVVFAGSVHVQRSDFELWSERLTVFFKPAQGAREGHEGLPTGMAAGDVDYMSAEKNVRMRSGERTGSCGKASYTPDKELIVMQIDPRLSDGKNSISGHEIRHYAGENRSEVIGGGQKRVEAVFSAPASKRLSAVGGRK
ncbi:MAG: organic solvent tolerance protein OstA [Desulfovibrionaceae bacterium]|nr:organic solvent tolerance protein OstA [Desulfovibrionaceae bacterium]